VRWKRYQAAPLWLRGFLPYLFERFRQADVSTTRAQGGLGLGLAIVRHLIEIHRGTVHAESAGKRKGATFTIRLPASAARSDVTAPKSEPEVRRKTSDAEAETGEREILSGLRVLLVDDDSDGRDVLALHLTQHRTIATVSDSAGDALGKVDTFRPDVNVADIGMPGEDDYSLIRKVPE
jgi:PleD family two-component response regulator